MKRMEDLGIESRSSAPSREKRAEELLEELFSRAGWRVRRNVRCNGSSRLDMVVSRGKVSYAVEVKASAEGRGDRLIPLWSQACLQASRAAGDHAPPLAVVAAPRISPRVANQVLDFAAEYAPDAAAGVIDFSGLRLFRGPHLEGLNSEGDCLPAAAKSVRSEPADLFSDLNQWMLKVLLAPGLPDDLLSAPRGRYRNASQLARAANVSVMSAFRLVQQLQRDGYLHESESYLNLVRREDLLKRWQAASARRVREVSMRFVLRGDPQVELKRMLRSGRACLGLFAAAEALHFGFVRGVPPYVYVQRLGPASIAAWKNVVPAEAGEQPDVILRQAPAPQSIFRGLVRANEMPVCDILQIWLDVSSHPSRGQEQADLIRSRVLDRAIRGEHERG
ncbi:MAG: hypothetical protein ACJ74Q_04655 [Pyrinomonadaceae bacterium]